MKQLLLISFVVVGLTAGVGYGVGKYLYQVGGVITAQQDPIDQFDIDYSNGRPVAPNLELQPTQAMGSPLVPHQFVVGETSTTDFTSN